MARIAVNPECIRFRATPRILPPVLLLSLVWGMSAHAQSNVSPRECTVEYNLARASDARAQNQFAEARGHLQMMRRLGKLDKTDKVKLALESIRIARPSGDLDTMAREVALIRELCGQRVKLCEGLSQEIVWFEDNVGQVFVVGRNSVEAHPLGEKQQRMLLVPETPKYLRVGYYRIGGRVIWVGPSSHGVTRVRSSATTSAGALARIETTLMANAVASASSGSAAPSQLASQHIYPAAYKTCECIRYPEGPDCDSDPWPVILGVSAGVVAAVAGGALVCWSQDCFSTEPAGPPIYRIDLRGARR